MIINPCMGWKIENNQITPPITLSCAAHHFLRLLRPHLLPPQATWGPKEPKVRASSLTLITGTLLGPQAHVQPGQPLPSTPAGADSPHHLPWSYMDRSPWGSEVAQALVGWRSKVGVWVPLACLWRARAKVREAVMGSLSKHWQQSPQPLHAVALQSFPALGCFCWAREVPP